MLPIDQPDYQKLPVEFREGVRRYVEQGQCPGNTLFFLLSNDLINTCFTLQPDLLARIKDLVTWLHWEIPSRCWGSPQAVNAWINHCGCQGLDETGKPVLHADD